MENLKIDSHIELRPLATKDADAVLALVEKNRSYLRQWLPWLDKTKSVEDIKKFIEGGEKRLMNSEGFELGIWMKDELAGVLGMTIKKDHYNGTIGYWLSENFQGQGIMTKAVRAVIEYSFKKLKLNRIVIRAALGNNRSRAVPERLGFKAEGVLREAEWLYDHFVDLQAYSLLEKEFKSYPLA